MMPAVASAGGGLAGPAAMQAAMGMPVTAPRAPGAPRGKTVTAIATVLADGTVMPRKMLPGRALVTSADLATVRRVSRTLKAITKALPTKPARRRTYRRRARRR